jgi:transcriptional regulator with XRE-family HTH domain
MRMQTNIIPQRLRYEREAKGWSTAELAKRAKLSSGSVVDNIEREIANPHKSTVFMLARALEVPIEALTQRDDRPKSEQERMPWSVAVLELVAIERENRLWRQEQVARRQAEYRARAEARFAEKKRRSRFQTRRTSKAEPGQ